MFIKIENEYINIYNIVSIYEGTSSTLPYSKGTAVYISGNYSIFTIEPIETLIERINKLHYTTNFKLQMNNIINGE